MLLDLIVDLVCTIYFNSNFGSNQSRIRRKIKRLSKYQPEILDLYNRHETVFEENQELSNLVLKSKVKNQGQRDELIIKIKEYLKSDNNG